MSFVRFSSKLAINLGDKAVGLAEEMARKVENNELDPNGKAAAEARRRSLSPASSSAPEQRR
jgi:hypothetical protein